MRVFMYYMTSEEGLLFRGEYIYYSQGARAYLLAYVNTSVPVVLCIYSLSLQVGKGGDKKGNLIEELNNISFTQAQPTPGVSLHEIIRGT